MAETLRLAEGARQTIHPAHRGATPRDNSASGAAELAGRSSVIARVHDLISRASGLSGGVLLVAEAGIDVQSIARELHMRGRGPLAPWVMVECRGIERAPLEKRLFGVSGPAPTDLESIAPESLMASARGGTLFLRDLTDLPAGVQARIARIARDGEVRLQGQAVATECRLVAAASPTIDADVHEHRFRPDLYRRLAATRIDLPPLRDRADDVPALAGQVLQELCAQDSPPRTFTQAALALLGALSWPGNLAELRGVIERVAAATREEQIQVEHVLPALQLERAPAAFVPEGHLRDARLRFERDYIASVLQHHGWRMADAARTLGIQRPNLYRKARQLGIPVARATES